MAPGQAKPKGRKRKLLPSDYTAFGDPHFVKDQQRNDQMEFSGTSDVEKDSLAVFSDLIGPKNSANLLDVSNFHGDLFPLSQAGKFIQKFQTKAIGRIKTHPITTSENARKKEPTLNDVCLESICSAETEIMDCNFRLCLETPSMDDSKHSEDSSKPVNLFNEESKQAPDCTSRTFAAMEIDAPLKSYLNGDEELGDGANEHLLKKKGKGRLQKMSEKTLGIRKAKNAGTIHMNTANNSYSTNVMEGENMITVDSLEIAVSETFTRDKLANDDSQKIGLENSQKSNLHPDSVSNMAGINENLDCINDRMKAFDQKLAAVKTERGLFSRLESNASNLPIVQLHATIDDCSITELNHNELKLKSASTGQHQLDEVTADTEFESEVLNNARLFLSNSSQKNSRADNHMENVINGSASGKQADKSSQKTRDQPSAIMSAICDQKASDSEKLSQHNKTKETNSPNWSAKETLQRETRPQCLDSDVVLDAELVLVQNINPTETCFTKAAENCGSQLIAEFGSSFVGKSTEKATQLHSTSDILLHNSSDVRQENGLNRRAVQSAPQELHSTFDDIPDITDSQMYLLDEESVTKPTSSSSTSMAIPSTGISCPGLANLAKALDFVKSAHSVYTDEAKRREGNKILQNLIKELTTVNAQLIRYRREIEKAKKERLERLRSNSCARQY